MFQLLWLGREYPKGEQYFREKCHNAFMKNKDVSDPTQIESLIARGEYVVKELEALYMLRKYRTLKKRYYSEQAQSHASGSWWKNRLNVYFDL